VHSAHKKSFFSILINLFGLFCGAVIISKIRGTGRFRPGDFGINYASKHNGSQINLESVRRKNDEIL
tara:strand:- start:537 stop:737 length:201 start_codon:yes stop_codon:yes gene_type:complete